MDLYVKRYSTNVKRYSTNEILIDIYRKIYIKYVI